MVSLPQLQTYRYFFMEMLMEFEPLCTWSGSFSWVELTINGESWTKSLMFRLCYSLQNFIEFLCLQLNAQLTNGCVCHMRNAASPTQQTLVVLETAYVIIHSWKSKRDGVWKRRNVENSKRRKSCNLRNLESLIRINAVRHTNAFVQGAPHLS